MSNLHRLYSDTFFSYNPKQKTTERRTITTWCFQKANTRLTPKNCSGLVISALLMENGNTSRVKCSSRFRRWFCSFAFPKKNCRKSWRKKLKFSFPKTNTNLNLLCNEFQFRMQHLQSYYFEFVLRLFLSDLSCLMEHRREPEWVQEAF